MPAREEASLREYLRTHAVPGAQLDERDLEAHAVRCERLVSLLARFVGGAERARVLEIGLGSGYVVAALHRRFGDALELHAIEHPARTLPRGPRFGEYLQESRLRFEVADLVARPLDAFAGTAFDAIVCSEVIEHVPPTALPDVLAGLAARLGDRGVLLLSSPNLRSFHRRASLAVGSGRILELPLPLPEADGTYGHVRLYARAEVEELLAYAGLAVVAWEYADFEAAFVRGALGTAQRLAARVVPSLSSGWLAAARAHGGHVSAPGTLTRS